MASLIVVAATCSAAELRAQGTADRDPALAETLFQSARELMIAGRFADACPKLAESHRLDPAGGTVLMLGQCHESAKKWASAWVAFNEAIGVAKKDGREDRERRARERLAFVETKMTRVSLKVSPEARAQKGLSLRRDGRDLPEAAWDTPLPLDPGDHVIEATAPGHDPWRVTFTVGDERRDQTIDVPALTAKAAAPTPPTASASASPPPPPEAQPKRRDLRLPAIGLGAAGVVALGVGTYFGVRAMSLSSDANDRCPQAACSDRAAVDDSAAASRAARVANVGVALGVVALGGAAVLWLSDGGVGRAAPRTRTVRLTPGVSVPSPGAPPGGSLSMEGAW